MTAQLLPIGTRVSHFGFKDLKFGHGMGTIESYNGTPVCEYAEEKLEDAANMAAQIGALSSIVESFYSGARCPYVVQWDHGYKDVYEPESLVLELFSE